MGDSRQHALISQPRKMNGLAFVKVNHREIQLNSGALKRHSNIYEGHTFQIWMDKQEWTEGAWARGRDRDRERER